MRRHRRWREPNPRRHFNASLFRDNEGEIVSALAMPGNAPARTVAEIVQHAAPGLLLMNEFHHVGSGACR